MSQSHRLFARQSSVTNRARLHLFWQNVTDDCRAKEQKMMNGGGVDRGIRLVPGIILIVLGLIHVLTVGLAIAAYCVGAIALFTG